MQLSIYTMLDLVAKTYTNPFYMHNDLEATRMFYSWLKNPELPMNAHPDDYSLYHIGYYDTDTGIIETADPHNLIVKGSSFKPELHAVGETNNG